MAFQAGSRIRPELGNADFSGFANAATIQANSLAQLGATIGSAIQVAGEKKKEKALGKQAQEMVFGFLKANPAQAEFFGLSEGFEMGDVKPVVDVIGAKPSIALMMQLKMASMKAGQTELPSVKDTQNFKEYVATLTSPKGDDLVVRGGMLYDEDIAFDDPLPADDPAVIAALRTKEGKEILTGYGDAIYGGTVDDDGTPVEPAEIIETPSINVQEEPTGSRASQLLRSIGDVNAKMRDVGSTSRAIPLGLKDFMFSPERTPFTESISSAKSKMESVDPFLRFFTKGMPF
jgi:hypothetical protein